MEPRSVEIRIGEGECGRFTRADFINLTLILIFCGAFVCLRWLKMDTLVSGDPARWLFEGQRVAAGELPYRDFSWNYPPFSVLLLGWVMRWFGVTFLVAQIFLDILSLGVVLFSYLLVRLLLPRFLHIPTMFWLIAVCGTSLMFFNLFSFLTYVPALQLGAAGFLLFLIGVLSYARTGRLGGVAWLILTLGAFVAEYSKPESLVAVFSTLAVLAIGDRVYWFAGRSTRDWLAHYAKLSLFSAGPALIAYLWTAKVAGSSNMRAGITGYGQAAAFCPWWPTGLGVFGAAASLGEAAFIAAALSLTRWKQFVARFGRTYYYGLAVSVAGLCVYFTYVLIGNWDLLTGNRSFADKIWYSAQSTVWTSAILLPVMWSCVALWFYLAYTLLLSGNGQRHPSSFGLLVLLTGPVAMSARGWFNWNQGIRTDVAGICYPFFLLLAPYLIWRFLSLGGTFPDARASIGSGARFAVVSLLTTYGLLRLIAAYPGLLSSAHYRGISTLAGNIRVTDYENDSEIYRFVIENTSLGDTILDLPYGGGMNFAAHRLSPIFHTQFRQVSMADASLEKDLERLRSHPPKVVIADNAANYGAVYGQQGCTCSFPHLVWSPGTSSVIPDKVFPALVEIEENYRVAKIVGRKLLLVPK